MNVPCSIGVPLKVADVAIGRLEIPAIVADARESGTEKLVPAMAVGALAVNVS